MKNTRSYNKTWLLALALFLTAHVAQANHHEDAEPADVDLEKMEQHKSIHRENRAHKRDRKGQRRAMQMHDRLDTNEDGKVDLNEFLSHAESRFNEMDANSDQFVTDEEAKQHHKNMRIKHQEMRKQHRQGRTEKADTEADQ